MSTPLSPNPEAQQPESIEPEEEINQQIEILPQDGEPLTTYFEALGERRPQEREGIFAKDLELTDGSDTSLKAIY